MVFLHKERGANGVALKSDPVVRRLDGRAASPGKRARPWLVRGVELRPLRPPE
jgi:hypothetical protein